MTSQLEKPESLTSLSEKASSLNIELLKRGARKLLSQYSLAERGAVPLELAAVLGHLADGGPSSLWPISSQDQARLGVTPGMKPRLQLWAGLRLVNETAELVHRDWPELEGSEFWLRVVQAHGSGIELANTVWDQAQSSDQADVLRALEELSSRLPPGILAYRMLSAYPKLQAAEELRAGELPTNGWSQLLDAPDDRIRRTITRAIGASYTIGGIALAYLSSRDRT